MKIWGKKLSVCIATLNFTNFKQKDTKCPKCSKSQVVKSKTYKKTDTKKKFLIYFIMKEIQKYFLNKIYHLLLMKKSN